LKVDAEKELVQALNEVLKERAYISPKIDPQVVKSVFSEMKDKP